MALEFGIFDGNVGVQIFGLIISSFLLAKTIFDYKRERLYKGGFIFWAAVWIGALTLFIIPGAARTILESLAVENVVLIGLLFSNVFLFIIVFILYGKLSSNDRRFKLFIQKLSIEKGFKEENNGKSKNSSKKTSEEFD